MIVESMTKAELYKELNQDEEWLLGRTFGLQKKYNKQLGNKNVPNLAILGRTWYTTPNHNKVYAIIQKYYVDEKQKYAVASITSLYEYTDNKGIKRYIYALSGTNGTSHGFILRFTAHAVSRMKERIGKDIYGVFEDICTKNNTNISVVPYTYNGNDEYCTAIGDNMAFMVKDDWGYVVKTIITKEQYYESQAEEQEAIANRHDAIAKETSNLFADLCKQSKAYRQISVKSA